MKTFPIILLLALTLMGCSERKPTIPGFHWNGSALYNARGELAAAVVVMPTGVDESQACIFSQAQIGESECTYWETGQQAYDYIDLRFKAAQQTHQR